MRRTPLAGDVEFVGAGMSRAAADARYVPRFVAGIETARAAQLVNSGGATENVLSNPNGALMGGIPDGIVPALLISGYNLRVLNSAHVMGIATSGNVLLTRANGSAAAPTQVLSGQFIAQVIGAGADNAGNVGVTLGSLALTARENITTATRGSEWRMNACDVGGAAPKLIVVVRGGGAGVGEVLASQATHRLIPNTTGALRNPANTADVVTWNATGLGVHGATPVARSAAIPNAAGGATIDAEARTALNALLAYFRTVGFITP
jgi:hypothetical protein